MERATDGQRLNVMLVEARGRAGPHLKRIVRQAERTAPGAFLTRLRGEAVNVHATPGENTVRVRLASGRCLEIDRAVIVTGSVAATAVEGRAREGPPPGVHVLASEGTPEELKDQVGGERLEIHLCDEGRGEEALSALTAIASEAPFLEDGSVRVPVSQRRGTIAEAVRRLDDAGIAIDDISVTTPTLDDVFLNLTGHAAEQETEEVEVAQAR